MSKDRINLFNLVMIVMMSLAFRFHLDPVAYVFTAALFVGCMAVVYIDFKALPQKSDPDAAVNKDQNQEVLGKNAKFLFDELCTRFNWVGLSDSEHTQPYVACDFTYTGPDGLVVPLRMSLETLPTKSG